MTVKTSTFSSTPPEIELAVKLTGMLKKSSIGKTIFFCFNVRFTTSGNPGVRYHSIIKNFML